MLQTPAKEDLGLVLAVLRCHLLDHGVVESASTSKRTPSLERNVVFLAQRDDVRVAHEGVQVDLVDGGEGRLGVDEFLDVLGAPV